MTQINTLQIFILCLFINLTYQNENDIIAKRVKHQPINIADHKLLKINEVSKIDHLKETVSKILIPRIVGSEGHDQVRDFIVKSLEEIGWNIERDVFDDVTPNMGTLTFENIIATLNPKAERYLILACHYDSKYMPGEIFLGATDSAVPCAMLINLAHVLKSFLNEAKKNNDLSIKLVFFDGEEAFEEWSNTDSIYGARHLSQKWNNEMFLPRIDMLILLDLIGMPDPKFYSFFRDTEHMYARVLGVEDRLVAANLLDNYTSISSSKSETERYFQPRSANSYIEDDHTPFLKLGVPIMHVIPVPFPDVWHKISDNHEVIDFVTVENINKILRVFVLEYLQVDV